MRRRDGRPGRGEAAPVASPGWPMLTAEIRETAAYMAADLEGRRLRVTLAWVDGGYTGIRVVEETNPRWYRDLCNSYPSAREYARRRIANRRKFDTIIRRRETLAALRRIAQRGDRETVYAQRLLPYIERVIQDLPKHGYMIE